MISSKEISQLPLPDEIFYLLLQIKTLVRVMPMVSVEVAILQIKTLVQATCSRACIDDSVLKSLPSCCLDLSSIPSVYSLDKEPAQDGVGDLPPYAQLSSFS